MSSPVISPVEFFGEFSFETFGEISQLIPTVIPTAGLSGYSSSDSSGLILQLIPPGKTLSLSRQTGQKNG